MRLFLAVPFEDDTRASLLAFLEDNGGADIPGRHVVAANWHITLRFLGRTDAEQHDRLVGYLAERVGGGSFTVRFGGLGAFPRPGRAAVAWLAIRGGAGRLSDLAALCEEAALAAGYAGEDRPFHAHVTLSRIRPPESMTTIVEGFPSFPNKLDVSRIVLYRSVLGGGPARYNEEEQFWL